MQKKKVCIVTWYRSLNYGTTVQCLALSKAVDRVGCEAYVPAHLRWYSLREPADAARRVWRKLRSRIRPVNAKARAGALDENVRQGYKTRMARTDRMIGEELRVYPMEGPNPFRRLCGDMHAFVTGSDQIWNPAHVAAPYLLSFTRDEDIKIAYGSSIGVSEIPRRLRPMYRRYLSRFLAIGVRETGARRLVEALTDAPVRAVLDPTFLLTAQDWREIAAPAEIPERYRGLSGYIFCYFIGDRPEWKIDAEMLSRKHGLPVICCLSESRIVPDQGMIFADAGAREFLWMIAHASMVLTDSFHAVALSINCGREFAVYKRFDDADPASQNSRITDVLARFELEERLVSGERTAESIFEKGIPWDKVGDLLDNLRADSLAFLKNALAGKP